MMESKQPEAELRESPKRPFGVYVLELILLLGIATAALEILRVQTGLEGVWITLDQLLRDRSGFVSMAARFVQNSLLLTFLNGLIIVVWLLVIIGLWRLQRWAWLGLMIFTGMALTYSLYLYFIDEPEYISMLTNVAVVFYLNERSVRRAVARPVVEAAG